MDDAHERSGHYFLHGRFPEDAYIEIGQVYNLDVNFNVQCTPAQELEPPAHTIQYNQVEGERHRRVLFDGVELITDEGKTVYSDMFHTTQHLRQMIENGEAMLDEAWDEELEEPAQASAGHLCDSCAVLKAKCDINTIGYNIASCERYIPDASGDQYAGRIILSTPESMGLDDPTCQEYTDDHPIPEDGYEIPIAHMWLAIWCISVAAISIFALAGWKVVDIFTFLMKG